MTLQKKIFSRKLSKKIEAKMKKNGKEIEKKIYQKEMNETTDLDEHYLSDTSTENDSRASSNSSKTILKSNSGTTKKVVNPKVTKDPNTKKRRQNQRINENKDEEVHTDTENQPHSDEEQDVVNPPLEKKKKELSESKKAALEKANRARLYKKLKKEFDVPNKVPTPSKTPITSSPVSETHPSWMDQFFHRLSETLKPAVSHAQPASVEQKQESTNRPKDASMASTSRPNVFQPLITRPFPGSQRLIF